MLTPSDGTPLVSVGSHFGGDTLADWPVSRNFVRTSLTNSLISPLRDPNIQMLSGSAQHDYCRFAVAFSRLAPSRLPLLTDRRTGRYADEASTLGEFVRRAFAEPVTDIAVTKEPGYLGPWIVTFTVFLNSTRGKKAHEHRTQHVWMAWEQWSVLEW